MKDAAFQGLLQSIRQAGRIRRGALKAVRTRVFRPADVIRMISARLASKGERKLYEEG